MRGWAALFFFLVMCGCGSDSDTTTEDAWRPNTPTVPHQRVKLPLVSQDADYHERMAKLPLARNSGEAAKLFGPILSHPWLQLQPDVKTLNRTIVDDIRLLNVAHQQLTDQRIKAGLNTPSIEDETRIIIQSLIALQRPSDELFLNWPSANYSVLNIPLTNPHNYPTPTPFQVHKRVHLFDNQNGFPTYLDLRVFHLKSASAEQEVLDIVEWHLSILRGGRDAFLRYATEDCMAFFGVGDHDTAHHNPTHGFAATNRGLFLAFLQLEDRLYCLYAEGPAEKMQAKEQELIQVLNRPMIPIQ